MAFGLLIVDDDPVTLLGLREGLQLKFPDAVIATAGSAEDALSQLNSPSHFDVVLSDVRMPGMDGMGLLREIKARFPECVVFLMTGHDPGLRVEALRLGASAFMDKPLDMQRLGTLLARAVDHARLLN
jgi:two-component system C4-dicarboxylate transport response regulator DctD